MLVYKTLEVWDPVGRGEIVHQPNNVGVSGGAQGIVDTSVQKGIVAYPCWLAASIRLNPSRCRRALRQYRPKGIAFFDLGFVCWEVSMLVWNLIVAAGLIQDLCIFFFLGGRKNFFLELFFSEQNIITLHGALHARNGYCRSCERPHTRGRRFVWEYCWAKACV